MKQHITRLVDDEGAVSPVIGVILMVAITVILAAVIGTFVLGLGGQVSQTAPQASVSVQSVDTAGPDAILLKHGGSDNIAFDELDIKVSVSETVLGTFSAGDGVDGLEFTTADTLNITDNTGSGDIAAFLNGHNNVAGTTGYKGSNANISATFGLDDGDAYTVTLIDQPSGQVIAEKTGTA